jgi:hypothetical protein
MLNSTCGLLSAFLPTYLSYVFLANELSTSSWSSAIPSIITALTLVAYDKSSTLPSTMSIMDYFVDSWFSWFPAELIR